MSLLRTAFTATTRSVLSRAAIRPHITTTYHISPVYIAYRSIGATPMTSSQQYTVSEAITKDHRELEDYYNKITAPNASLETQKEYQNLFVWELARHSIGEELVVYPAFEKHLGAKGKQMADKDRADHAEVKKMLYDWQSMSPEDGEFMNKLKTMWKELSQHIKEEEDDDLPQLEKALADENASRKMGKSFSRTKKFVPTRSHPDAPDKPPFETAAGLLAAPLDKLMDAFRKFPQDD